MTMLISHFFLQEYWWLIISLLAGLLVFLMFVQGGQSLLFSLSGDETHRTMIINALGRKWEFTFTTLVTFGGAFFASFPLFYSVSFGGAYWIWITILFSFTIQAIAYEFRSKPANVYGRTTFDIFLFINGSLGPFLIGVVVATFFTGSRFSLNNMNQVQWETSWHGLEALLNVRNLSLGFAVLFLARCNGLLYIINSVDNESLVKKCRERVLVNSVIFFVCFLFFILTLIFAKGFASDQYTNSFAMEKYKYLNNLIQMPLVLIIFLLGVSGILYGISISVFKTGRKGIWFTGAGSVLTVFSLFLVAGYNGTSFYPSIFDPESSLTIRNASSSHFTLKTMMYVSFIIPLVALYIWSSWKSINKSRITENEMKTGGHVY